MHDLSLARAAAAMMIKLLTLLLSLWIVLHSDNVSMAIILVVALVPFGIAAYAAMGAFITCMRNPAYC